MKNFKNWLTEAFSASASNRIDSLIKKYLEKKIGEKFTKMPGIEDFTNDIESGYGIRYFYGNKSVRFNWKSSISSMSLHSVDLWDGKSRTPSYHIEFSHEASIVKMLPTIVDIMLNPVTTSFYAIPQDDLNEEIDFLTEIVNKQDVWEEVITALKDKRNIGEKYWDIINRIGSRAKNIVEQIRLLYPDAFEKNGRAILYTGNIDIADVISNKSKLLGEIGAVPVKVTGGYTKELIKIPKEIQELEDAGLERLAYEDQLNDLSSLIKLVLKGASNSLWIAGRGGIGKTHTVERELAAAGLRDGAGYFKNTGSASPIGIYKLLFRYKNEIILFDDSDGALADQDSRNILKAATDTLKVRKLVWNKESKSLVDPDEIDPEDETDTRIPKYFEFSGKILFISNLPINKLDPDGALRTRGLMIDISPTNDEIFTFMEKIVDDIPLEDGLKLSTSSRKSVVDMLRKNTRGEINLRKLVRGLNIMAALGDTGDVERMIKLYA